jgi:hypothetical protein
VSEQAGEVLSDLNEERTVQLAVVSDVLGQWPNQLCCVPHVHLGDWLMHQSFSYLS